MGRDPEGWFERYRRRGDLRALERVFDRSARDLLALAMHLVRDPDDAEDLVQATFVTAIDRAQSYDRSRPLLPWLSGILAGKAANLIRARALRDGSGEALEVRTPSSADPARRAESRELDAALAAALERVGDPYREVLEAYLVGGERPAHAGRVAEDEVPLQLLELSRLDRVVGEPSEAGVDPVHRLPLAEHRLDGGPRARHLGACALGEAHRRLGRRLEIARESGQRQRRAVQDDRFSLESRHAAQGNKEPPPRDPPPTPPSGGLSLIADR